jgi:alpha-L-fucosidase
MTEACNSVGVQSWGYREGEDFYSIRHLISSIDKIMAMNGSYLLNVGPDAKGVIREEYASRIRKIGDWYNRMGGCLESAEPDEFDYKIHHDEYVKTKKDGKTYLHFYNGLMSDSVAIENYPSIPKSVRLMNTGCELPFKVEALPEFFNGYNGKAERTFLNVKKIPVDELANEAIVLEIEW